MDVRFALAFLMLVTMVTAINLRKQFRPNNDNRAEYQIPDFENDPAPDASCETCGDGTCCSPNTCYKNFCYAPIVQARRSNTKEIPNLKNDPAPEASCETCGEKPCCSPNTCYNNFCYPPIVPVVGETQDE